MELARILLNSCDNKTSPLEVLKKGVELLQKNTLYDEEAKQKMLIEIVSLYANGKDGFADTDDDRLSPETVKVLTVLIESDMVGYVIDGIVANIKKRSSGCFKKMFG
jgi:hypothetical protein